MLKEVTIGSYRGLEQVYIGEFGKVNVFVGANNSGKTSILEGIMLSGLFQNAELFIEILSSRYPRMDIDMIKAMFHANEESVICIEQVDDSGTIVHTHILYEENLIIDSEMEKRKEVALGFRHENNEHLEQKYQMAFNEAQDGLKLSIIKEDGSDRNFQTMPCQYISFSHFDAPKHFMEIIDSVLDSNRKMELLEVLRIFDKDVINFEVIGKKRIIKIFRQGEENALSLYDYGNGMYKAFFIAAASILCKDGILLIDEVEAGIHKEALGRFMNYLIKVSKKNHTQIFLTTHSLEALDVILEEERKELENIAVFNINQHEGKMVARKYSGEKLLRLRSEMGIDIR